MSILKEKSDFYGVGIDLSQKCIDISKINASKLGIKNRVKFFKSDIDNFRLGKYDLIISNPPYINNFELSRLDEDIKSHEPKLALSGGSNGFRYIKKVIIKSKKLLKINGKLIVEIGNKQKKQSIKILKENGFYINKVSKDLSGKERCIISTKFK